MADPLLLDDDAPFDDEVSAQQLAGLIQFIGPSSKHILELGSGAGRILIPLAQAGHYCTGIDINSKSRKHCAEQLQQVNAKAELLQCDFLRCRPNEWNPNRTLFDAIVCVGNTFMTIVDVDDAVQLMERVRAALKPNGSFIIDNIPQEHWPELIDGNWQSGVNDEGDVQMVWAQNDAVFALREGEAVDDENWELSTSDRKLRLWTMGCLRLAARAAHLSGPQPVQSANLLVFGRGE